MSKNSNRIELLCPMTGALLAVSPQWAAAVTGRSVRTAQRWAMGRKMDKASRDLLVIHAFGVMPGDAWRNFRIRADRLENLETGETWTPMQLRATWISLQQLGEYKRKAEIVPSLPPAAD